MSYFVIRARYHVDGQPVRRRERRERDKIVPMTEFKSRAAAEKALAKSKADPKHYEICEGESLIIW